MTNRDEVNVPMQTTAIRGEIAVSNTPSESHKIARSGRNVLTSN